MSMLEPTVVLLGGDNQYAANTPVKHPIRARSMFFVLTPGHGSVVG